MRFDWDPAKNERTIRERGIDFADVVSMFAGPMFVVRDDRRGEVRWVGLGEVEGRVMVVVWTVRDEETYRIISARKANRREVQRYASKARPGG
jgi:uncharacterized DUF497 family protein